MRKIKSCILVCGALLLLSACGKTPAAQEPTVAPTPTVTAEPTATATPTPTTKPTPTEKPTPTPMGTNLPAGIGLKNSYGETFGHIGTCVNGRQFSDPAALAFIKEHFNSITMENEMKPDAVLGSSATLISLDEAKALGYVIPENYKESMVPQLNFYYTDRALQFCVENDMGLRGHTLVWHSQTPSWFFKEDFKSSGAFVSPEVMDARLEFFIRSVMGHVYDQDNGSALYSWDVVNEYVHANENGWKQVYGEEGLSAGFVKKAFVIADDVLRQYGIREKVSLLYNDFNTYSEMVQIINLLEFVNSDGKVCDGVGMQSHLTVDSPHVIKYITAMKKFLEAGHEVHITELDVGNSNDIYQAQYCYDIMEKMLELKKEGAAINGITWWGVADTNSWRPGEKALMFKTIKTPKASYYKVLEAYVDAGLYTEE